MNDAQDTEAIREKIEGRIDKATAGPTEGFDVMEEAAEEAKLEAELDPQFEQGQDIPTQPVSEEDRMAEPPRGRANNSYS